MPTFGYVLRDTGTGITMVAMGQFKVAIDLYPREGGFPRPVEALVDTRAAYTVLPRPLLEALGYAAVRRQRVILADGRAEEWEVTQAEVECHGRRTFTPILMGSASGPALLGATTLEELGLGVDPLSRRLVPVDLYLTVVHQLYGWGTGTGAARPDLARPDSAAGVRLVAL